MLSLITRFFLKCFSLGVKVNYVVSVDSQYKMISAQEDYLDVLQKLREESNKEACLHYDTRMDRIKKSMLDRNAPEEQFEELKKIESVYNEIKNLIK